MWDMWDGLWDNLWDSAKQEDKTLEPQSVQGTSTLIPVLKVGGSSPFGRARLKTRKVLQLQHFAGFFMLLLRL